MADVWESLPAVVREAVGRHVGPVRSVTAVASGRSNDLAVAVHGDGGPVFVKGVRGISRRMRCLRNEITTAALAGSVAPAVLFAEDVTADADTGTDVGSDSVPWLVVGWDVTRMDRWASLAPEAVAGDRLIHTDLHADQFILGADGEFRVIDWGFPGAAAGWVDSAFLTIRLVAAGHSPRDAEAWAAARPGWPPDGRGDRGGAGEALTAFAAYVAGLWTYRAVTDGVDGPWVRAARDYAAWRTGAEIV